MARSRVAHGISWEKACALTVFHARTHVDQFILSAKRERAQSTIKDTGG